MIVGALLIGALIAGYLARREWREFLLLLLCLSFRNRAEIGQTSSARAASSN
jgi:hypothetical protein